MDLKDMILVTENDRGTETNMLMALDDYKSFIAVDDMSELAENLLQLGRTLGEADNFTEYYRAANVTVSARFCLDDIQLGHFLQGFYNDSKEFRFDKEASSSECVAMDCQHFFRQIFLGYFSDIVQAFDTLRKNVCGDDYTSLHNPIVLSSVLPAYGMFHSIQILFL